jgi:hypothetical protein
MRRAGDVAEAIVLFATSSHCHQAEAKTLQILMIFYAVASFALVITLYA